MDLFTAPPDLPPRSPLVRSCTACGACCAAPDIHALGKPLGVKCVHLRPDCLCGVYAARPAVCRNYRPDWVCGEVAPLPTLAARVTRFLQIYGLEKEAPVRNLSGSPR
ncbi:zinc/iron-chelating domain-containing protein [Deinococcus aetherius]|uniref:Zinc/iron-chelating domain-containing protein n=1 Tax=Deinococcus aetherius TaxID=200252 RepID=A0ABN6RNC3_9DEIO|nr:YkgJ family cysteine cluster protein [Deinococcus aetherius]BDP43117.1 zinc/iron-chelating domain-containing protein [Deinococcus aetherius]